MNYSSIVMKDARIFSDYKPSAMNEKEFQLKNGIKDNESYRRYLINNGSSIMINNERNSMRQNIPMMFVPRIPGQNIPHVFDSIKDKKFPYGYETNSTKVKYLSRQELASTKVNAYKYCNI